LGRWGTVFANSTPLEQLRIAHGAKLSHHLSRFQGAQSQRANAWNGQNMGINHIDIAQKIMINGMPTFMKSVNL
jgi:hypothetical protein